MQPDSELTDGAGGWGFRVGSAERCGVPGVQVRKSPQPLLSVEEEPARSGRCRGCPVASAAKGGWRAASESAAGRSRAGGTRSFGLRGSSGGLGQDLPEGGRGNLRFCCQEPRLVCVCGGCLPGVWILSREPSQDPATVGGEPAQGPVGAPGSGVGWHRAPDRRGPRGPLFPLHVARFSCQARGEGGGRREGAAALTCRR